MCIIGDTTFIRGLLRIHIYRNSMSLHLSSTMRLLYTKTLKKKLGKSCTPRKTVDACIV